MIDEKEINKGKYFFHPGIGETVFDREATAALIGCSVFNLSKLRGLKPLKSRWNRLAVFAKSDIEAYLARR